ncbi:hypothetical protein B0H63DRAFT_462312 [Podospora didyma]|uniref:Uncharacterized protein n=1 Tax=Podospora didyma TaxID=330526 RepID=A0AAE0U8G2_9PEZI|nr:hypothetical protein B0H63DRAFT_462312 [Podospora didyma]
MNALEDAHDKIVGMFDGDKQAEIRQLLEGMDAQASLSSPVDLGNRVTALENAQNGAAANSDASPAEIKKQSEIIDRCTKELQQMKTDAAMATTRIETLEFQGKSTLKEVKWIKDFQDAKFQVQDLLSQKLDALATRVSIQETALTAETEQRTADNKLAQSTFQELRKKFDALSSQEGSKDTGNASHSQLATIQANIEKMQTQVDALEYA